MSFSTYFFDLDKNFITLASSVLEHKNGEQRNRAEILDLNLRGVEKSDIKSFVEEKFMLHDALIAGDFDLAKWFTENDLVNPNSNRTTRNHNYQYFRLTPLHTAIAIYHDKLYSGSKEPELKPLEEMIDILQKKFFEKNGSEESKNNDFTVNLTYRAYNNFKEKASEEAVAATKIQRSFRASVVEKLKPQNEDLRVK